MWILLGMLFLFSGLVYVYREIRFIKSKNDLYIISFMRLLYACSCGFFAAILCFLYAFRGIQLHLSTLVVIDYSTKSLEAFYIFWFCSVIGYIALSGGYKLVGNKKIVFRISQNRRAKKRGMTDQQVFWIALACTMVGVLALIIWTSDMGGIQSYIELASAIRGDYSNVYGNYHMGWRKIAKILLPATYMFFFLALKEGKRKLYYWFFFIISLIAAVIFLICNDGRLTTAMFFLILAVGFYRYGKRRSENIKRQFIHFGILLLIAFVLLANLDTISYMIRNSGEIPTNTSSNKDGILLNLMSEFSYIYKSGVTAVLNSFPEGKLMIIDDIMFGLKAYLPGGYLFGDYIQVSRYNTILCTGDAGSLAGSIPCDIIALSLYDLSYLGVLVIPFTIGAIVRFIENHYTGKKDNPLSQTFYYGLTLIFIRVVTYCEVYDFFTAVFPYIILWVISLGINWSHLLLRRRLITK